MSERGLLILSLHHSPFALILFPVSGMAPPFYQLVAQTHNLDLSLIWVIFDICLSLMPHIIQSSGNFCQLNLENIFNFWTTSLSFHCHFPNLTATYFLQNSLNCLQTGLFASILAFAQVIRLQCESDRDTPALKTLGRFPSHSALEPGPPLPGSCCPPGPLHFSAITAYHSPHYSQVQPLVSELFLTHTRCTENSSLLPCVVSFSFLAPTSHYVFISSLTICHC